MLEKKVNYSCRKKVSGVVPILVKHTVMKNYKQACPSFLTSSLDVGNCLATCPEHFTSGKSSLVVFGFHYKNTLMLCLFIAHLNSLWLNIYCETENRWEILGTSPIYYNKIEGLVEIWLTYLTLNCNWKNMSIISTFLI